MHPTPRLLLGVTGLSYPLTCRACAPQCRSTRPAQVITLSQFVAAHVVTDMLTPTCGEEVVPSPAPLPYFFETAGFVASLRSRFRVAQHCQLGDWIEPGRRTPEPPLQPRQRDFSSTQLRRLSGMANT